MHTNCCRRQTLDKDKLTSRSQRLRHASSWAWTGKGKRRQRGARSNKRKSQISCQQAACPTDRPPLFPLHSLSARRYATRFWHWLRDPLLALTTGCVYPLARSLPAPPNNKLLLLSCFAPLVYPRRGQFACDAPAQYTVLVHAYDDRAWDSLYDASCSSLYYPCEQQFGPFLCSMRRYIC